MIPGWERCPGEGNGSPLKYSCLENSMDRGSWWATVHGVLKNQTQLSNYTHTHTHTCTHAQLDNILDLREFVLCGMSWNIAMNSSVSHLLEKVWRNAERLN